ncbi:UDP-N-acetylmuramoyl-tripeptide--D-alanyl-D-alanine ligase [Sphingobium sp. CR28]|uniref:UDP-N-acetylmuramoyl-tripeptide--D-alanyl-D- alanine ligase n=1 Tax=Sphingobium sp. CR28 TaxID=3400272 RepID=UPI003FF0F561
MSPLWTSTAIAHATGGKASRDFGVAGVAFDSREIAAGDLFVAMKGAQSDGHDFVARAFAAGAGGVLVERPVEGPHVLVNDSAEALVRLGVESRRRTNAKVIGVTGSAGKTSTKEALFQAFDRISMGNAHRSLKSYNNHVGVPLSLARMPEHADFGIFEMGMNHAGELSELTRMVKPNVALVTTIAPAHIEYFGTEEKIADAKGEIFEGLTGEAVAVLPYDSPHIKRLYAKASRHARRIITFGAGEGADVRAVEQVAAPGGGTLVTARLPEARLSFTVSAPGAHWVQNALAVLAVVDGLGGDLAVAGLALAELPGLPGRGARRRIALDRGGEALLIDESYNANPASVAATLAQISQEAGKRKVAVIGAMKELGALSESLHAGLAEPILQAGVDLVLLVGAETAPLGAALRNKLTLHEVADAAGAVALLPRLLKDGDVILVKGSNSVGLSRLIAELSAEKV